MPQIQHDPLRDSGPGLNIIAGSDNEAQLPQTSDLTQGLAAEYAAALRTTATADREPLRAAGVGLAGLGIAAFAKVRLSRDRSLFEFDADEDVDPACILPVRGANPLSPEALDPAAEVCGGPIVDLVAFSPAFPHRWALRTGAATWLGCIEPQYLAPVPVPVWRSPLHWLGNDLLGIVLLTRDRRERYRVLSCCDAILAEDEAHAEALRELLARPWLAPPVFVRQARQEVRRAA